MICSRGVKMVGLVSGTALTTHCVRVAASSMAANRVLRLFAASKWNRVRTETRMMKARVIRDTCTSGWAGSGSGTRHGSY
jgi:hypothetical protein